MDYLRLSHVAFYVRDLKKSFEFYCDKLGAHHAYTLYKEDHTPWLAYLEISPLHFIELFPIEPGVGSERGSCAHYSLVVADIEQAAVELQQKGVQLWYGHSYRNCPAPVPFVKRRARCGSYAFFVVDPDGNEIEIQQYTELSLQLCTRRQWEQELDVLITRNLQLTD